MVIIFESHFKIEVRYLYFSDNSLGQVHNPALVDVNFHDILYNGGQISLWVTCKKAITAAHG